MNTSIRSACLFLLLSALFTTPLFAQTKFYLNTGTTSTVSPAFNAGWNVFSGANRYEMSVAKDNSTIASKTTGNSGTGTPRKCLADQWISKPLATQTITGTFTGQVRFQQVAGATGQGYLYLRLINADGSIFSEIGTGTTTNVVSAPTALTNRTITFSVSPLNISVTAGQRISIDLGWNCSAGASASTNGTISEGSSSGSDMASDNASTTANNPFVQFSQVLLFQPPANDDCANAKVITTDSVCKSGTSSLTGETLSNATDGGYTITSSCFSSTNTPDVWYKFVAKTQYPTITISNPGSGWGGISNVKIQLLSGTCASFTEVACASGATLTPALTSPLTQGNTYYIRIHKNTSGIIALSHTFDICVTDAFQRGSRMNEIFARTVLSPASVLNYPWEVTYGVDGNLWVTEAQGYKMSKIDPNTGVKTTVLDLSAGSTWLPSPLDSLNGQINSSWSPWPQGGFAGMALHPNFLDGTGNTDFVYVAYVHRFLSGTAPSGLFYRNKLVRFTYNSGTGKLEAPVVICDTLPGSKDHNSQRMIIAPVVKGGTNYLFYGEGDMGAGQFENQTRTNKAQNVSSYEGKILRFNLVPDVPAGAAPWIPDDNPYSPTSAVYAVGFRNNQGFAYDTALNILYGSSHGPYSDDEINIIEPHRNYGHPLVIGYAEGNYNGNPVQGSNNSISAGAAWDSYSGVSSCPPVGNEATNVGIINGYGNGAYHRPLFSAYPTPSTGANGILNTWKNDPNNSQWYSEAWSGLDLYTNNIIPGWKKSLVASGLKWGRLLRLPLDATGLATLPSTKDSANVGDTITYFQSTNRYRDIAFAPNGKDIFVVMDNSSATSGPGVANPTTPACPGCLIKYSFLGYADAGGVSTISDSIWTTTAAGGNCYTGTQITIDASNNYLWVPITGPDGNIMAEINAMGQNLGVVNSSFYKTVPAFHASRSVSATRYLDRNITIVPAVKTFGTPVKVRFYIPKGEFDSLVNDPLSGITAIANLKILKNADLCSATIGTPTTAVTPTVTASRGPSVPLTSNRGYVLQTTITDFTANSSFYFAANNVVLPVDLVTFTGTLQNDLTTLLKWKTENEINTARFEVERSIDGNNFSYIGNVAPKGSTSTSANYSLTDIDAAYQQSSVLYYRLKIIDINGTIKYSNIIKITLPDIKGTITISPNPVSTELRSAIVATTSSNVTWQVIDSKGSTVLQGNAVFNKGNNKLSINTSQLSSGSYYLRITGSDKEIKASFQKL